MTVSTATSRSGPYAGAGTIGPFTVNFRFLDAAHLSVIRTDTTGEHVLVLSTDYSVAGVGNPTGSVTLLAALPVGQTLTIIRDVPVTQEADYVQNDDFPAESHENVVDKLTMISQQLVEAQDRALTLPASSPSGVSTVLPVPASNQLLGWNPAANGLQNMDPNTLATIVAFGTVHYDLFSGTGAQTVFTLSGNPGVLGNLIVVISGVVQRPTIDYTWTSPTTLVFTTAPPAGASNILVRFAQALPQGVTDSAAAQFIQSGTGATARTAQDKMRERVSVKDFGAKGDNVADDTLSVQRALDFGGIGSTVHFPPGVYRINGTLTRYPGQIIQGSGWADITGSYNLQAGSTVLLQTSVANVPLIQAIGSSDNDQRQRGGLRDIALKHTTEGSLVGTGYKAINSRQNSLDNVYIASFNVGIEQGDNCWQWAMRNVLVFDSIKCLFAHDEGEDSTYTSCIFRPYRNSSTGAHLKNMSQTNLFLGCDFSNATTGALLEQGDTAGNGTGVPYPMNATFMNCQFENVVVEAIKMVSSVGDPAKIKYLPQVIAIGCRAFNSNSPNAGQLFITAQQASYVEVRGLQSVGYSYGINIGTNVGQVVWHPGPGSQFGSADASGQIDRIFEVPSCRLQSAALSFVAGNFTAVPYSAVVSDVASWYAAVGAIKPTRPGRFRAKASIYVDSAPVGRYSLILKTDGGSDATLADFYVPVAGQPLLLSGDLPVTPGGNNTYSVVLYSTASFAVNTTSSFFSIEPMGG